MESTPPCKLNNCVSVCKSQHCETVPQFVAERSKWLFTIYTKFPEVSRFHFGIFRNGTNAFHLPRTGMYPIRAQGLSAARLVYFRFEYGGTAQLLFIDELFKDDLNMMEDEDDTIVFSAISTFMRKDLQRNENFCEAVLPRFSLDEFRGHFRMIRGTMEVLCRGCGHRQGTAGTCIWETPNSTRQTRCLICLVYTTPESYQPF